MANSKIAINIPEYNERPARVTRSYHSSKFINIGSNGNTCKYNFFCQNHKKMEHYTFFFIRSAIRGQF